jgi:hypothetical protein
MYEVEGDRFACVNRPRAFATVLSSASSAVARLDEAAGRARAEAVA